MKRKTVPILRRQKSYCLKYRTPEGKQKWESFKTEWEAQERRLEILEQFKDEAYVEPKTVAFKDFAEKWIEQRLSIRGSTASAYASVIKQHLIPYFGKTKLAQIRPATVQRFVSSSLKKELSPKTVRNATILLRTMLASPKGFSAIQQGLIRYNPTAGVELPTQEHREVLLITVKQAWKLINAASEFGRAAHGLVYLGAHTGMRRGEVLAVSFSDVDWEQKELLVSKGLSKFRTKEKLRRRRWRLGPTKSRKSRRRIGLDDEVIKVLRTLRDSAPDPDGFIFCKPDGHPFDPDYFDELFDKIRRKVELPDVRFHDLRHFFASMLIAQGESAKYVSDQLGHSSVQVTFDIYDHLFPTARQDAARKFQQAMLIGSKKLVAEGDSEGHTGEGTGNPTERIN